MASGPHRPGFYLGVLIAGFIAGGALTALLRQTLPDSAASADDLMRAADGAMYEVKARGKNGIHAARPPADKQAVGNSESTSEVNGR